VRIVVGNTEEIPSGERKIIDVSGRSIGVFNVDGHYYAVRDLCPHHGAPLCRGRVVGTVLASEPTEYVYDSQRKVLRCPWHGFEFDLETGLSPCDPRNLRVKVYKVTIQDDEIVIDV